MSTAVEIACDAEQLCDTQPGVRRAEVFCGSDLLPRLIWPDLRFDHYDGPDGGLFGHIRERYGLASVFAALAEDDVVHISGPSLMSEIGALQRILLAHRAELPPLYELVGADGQAYLELHDGRSTIICGYHHCAKIAHNGALQEELRGEYILQFAGKSLSVRRDDVFAALDPELKRILVVANTARTFGQQVEIRVV